MTRLSSGRGKFSAPLVVARVSRVFIHRGWLLGLCALMGAIAAPVAAAVSHHVFTIPAGAAADGLQAFARQSGLQVLFPYDAVARKRVPAVSGDLADAVVLRRLAAASGLVVTSKDGHTVTLQARPSPVPIVKAPPVATPDDCDPTLVLVTAMKRSEAANDVPVAMAVFRGRDLAEAGIGGVSDLQDIDPSLIVNRDAFGITTSIRGVTSTDVSNKGEQGVAYNVDGVYVGRPFQQGLPYFDVDRVEILKGPQGTLYGKSSTGGVINVVTQKPDLDRFEAAVRTEIGNYHTRRAEAVLNLPLAPALALRVAADVNRRDGYLIPGNREAARNDENTAAGRMSLLYAPNADLSFRLTDSGGHVGGAGAGQAVDARLGHAATQFAILPDPVADAVNDNFNTLNGELNVKTHGVAVTWLGSIQHYDAHERVPSNNNPAANYLGAPSGFQPLYVLSDNHWNLHAVEQELRLANARPEAVDYVIGFNYVRENVDEQSHVWNAPVATAQDTATYQNARNFLNRTTHASTGLFGQLTWHVAERLDIVLGLRQSNDRLTRYGTAAAGATNGAKSWYDAAGQVCTYPAQCVGDPNNGHQGDRKLTYRAGVNYHVKTGGMVYGSVATGYKAGGFNDFDPVTLSASPYGPESLTAYELGYKGIVAGPLSYATSLFYYDYAGDQINSRIVIAGTAVSFTRLVPARIWGWESQLRYRFGEGTTATLSTSAERSEFTDFRAGLAQNVDWSGQPLDKTPHLTATAALDHGFSLPGGATLTLHGRIKYSSGYLLSDFVNAVRFRQPAFTRTGASLDFSPASRAYSVELFVDNLENGIQRTGAPTSYSATIANATTFAVSTPRFYGVRLTASF